MNAPQIWDSLSRNQKNLTGLSALLVALSVGFGAMKAIDPYLPGPIRAEIATERAERIAGDDSLRSTLQRVLDGQVALLDGQRQLVNAVGLAVDVLADPSSPQAADARRKLRAMRTVTFNPEAPDHSR